MLIAVGTTHVESYEVITGLTAVTTNTTSTTKTASRRHCRRPPRPFTGMSDAATPSFQPQGRDLEGPQFQRAFE